MSTRSLVATIVLLGLFFGVQILTFSYGDTEALPSRPLLPGDQMPARVLEVLGEEALPQESCRLLLLATPQCYATDRLASHLRDSPEYLAVTWVFTGNRIQVATFADRHELAPDEWVALPPSVTLANLGVFASPTQVVLDSNMLVLDARIGSIEGLLNQRERFCD